MDARPNGPTTSASDPLPREFYERDTVTVSRELLGQILVRTEAAGNTAGLIVETEAYLTDDPGSHASRGRTERNSPMFAGPGTIYVYQIYGIHFCLNIVTRPAGIAEAILIRAVEPVGGLQLMKQRRGRRELKELTSGPAKLTEAMSIDLSLNEGDITRPPLYVVAGAGTQGPVAVAPRIGLGADQGADLPLRFCLADSEYLSRPIPSALRGASRPRQ